MCVVKSVAGATCSPLGGGPAEDSMMRAERVEQLRAIRREGGRAAAKVSKKEDESFMKGLRRLLDGAGLRALATNVAILAGMAVMALLCSPGAAHAARSGGRMGGGFGGRSSMRSMGSMGSRGSSLGGGGLGGRTGAMGGSNFGSARTNHAFGTNHAFSGGSGGGGGSFMNGLGSGLLLGNMGPRWGNGYRSPMMFNPVGMVFMVKNPETHP